MNDIKLLFVGSDGRMIALKMIDGFGQLFQIKNVPADEFIEMVYSFVHDKDTKSIDFRINQYTANATNNYSKIYISKDLLTTNCIWYNTNITQFDCQNRQYVVGCSVIVNYQTSEDADTIQTLKLGIYKDLRSFLETLFRDDEDKSDIASILLVKEIL